METKRRGLLDRKWIIAILVYVALIAICCIALYAVPSLKGALEKTYIAEYGRVDVTDEVSAFIVRDEIVYVAGQDSKINQLAEADKLVKAGAAVVELTPTDEAAAEATEAETAEEGEDKAKDESKDKDKDGSGDDAEAKEGSEAGSEAEAEAEPEEIDAGKYTSIMEELGDAAVVSKDGSTSNAGYISYYVDGAEAKLTTDALSSLTYDDYKSLTGRRAIKVPQKKCGKGYPIFKVVRNKKWYLVYYVSNEAAEKYTEGNTVTVDFDGEPVDVTVTGVEAGSKESKITLSCKTFFDGFLEMRNLDTTVTVASAEGLVLKDSSIVDGPDGTRGVFVVDKLGEHVYTPVRAVADDGKQCVVYSDIYVDDDGNYVETIGTYDEIVETPSEEDIASLTKKPEPEAKESNDGEGEGAGGAVIEEAPAEEAPAAEETPAEETPAEEAPAADTADTEAAGGAGTADGGTDANADTN